MAQVAALWRHPIKSHGREQIASVDLTQDQAMPWDRVWAVYHDNTKIDPAQPDWAACQNFMIGSRAPLLAGIWAKLNEDSATITLTHRDLGALTFSPDTEAARFLDWVAPLCPTDRARPVGIVRIGARGMTDTDFPSVSLTNLASHRAVETVMDRALEPERWRGNIWFDGEAPWVERDWIGRDLRLGQAVLHIEDHVVRCLHTTTNPVTGERDADTLGMLDALWGEKHFGVYARVLKSGRVSTGDKLELI
jgi:uncharacterized protein YcbX